MDTVICPKCGIENPSNAMNCKNCRINLRFALEHPQEIEHIRPREQAVPAASLPQEGSYPELGVADAQARGKSLNTFPQSSRVRATERKMGIAALAVAAISGAASVCAFGSTMIIPGIALILFAVFMLVFGIHSLKSKPFLAIGSAGISLQGYWLTNNNWNLPWSSVGHAQVITTIIGDRHGRALHLYHSRETSAPLKVISEFEFDNFEGIVRLVGEQMMTAGHPLEEIEKTVTPPVSR